MTEDLHRAPWTPQQDAEMLRLHNLGLEAADIGERIGRSVESVRRRRIRLRELQQRPAPKNGGHRPRGFSAKTVKWARRTFRPAEFRLNATGDQGEATMILAMMKDRAAKGAAR